MNLRYTMFAGMLLLLSGCGTDPAPPETLPLRGWGGEEVDVSTTVPEPVDEIGPVAGTGEDALRRANAELLDAASSRASIVPWFSKNCRAQLGLPADDDPISQILAGQSLLDADLEVVNVSVDGTTGVVTLDEEYQVENHWVLEDDTWRFGDCAVVEAANDLTSVGESTQEGLEARLAQIRRMVGAEETGKYGWLSQRCRQDSVEQLASYPGLIGMHTDHFSTIEPWWTFDVSDILVIDTNGFAMVSRWDPTSPAVFEGEPASRWIFETGNWYYDGCLEDGEEAIEISPDGSPKEDRTIEDIHLELVENPIEVDGLTLTSSGYDEFNGYRFRYEIDSPTTEEAASALMTTALLPALQTSGYNIQSQSDRSAIVSLDSDGCGWANVSVAWQIPSSSDPHVIYVDLALQC